MSRFARLAMVSASLLAAAYLGDYVSLRYHIPNRPQFGSVHLQSYAAVPRKDGKTDFLMDEPEDRTCVHSVFPHFGDPPCWYLEGRRSKRVNL